MKNILIISFILLFSSGCFSSRTKTKKKTKTVFEIDTVISIKPEPEIKKSIPFENLLQSDTLKIETERNLIKVYYKPENKIENRKSEIEISNNEKEIKTPVKIKETIISNETELKKESLIKQYILENPIFSFLLLCFFVYWLKLFIQTK